MVVDSDGTAMLSQLPPLAVESMTQIQLNDFIPQLITLVTGQQCPSEETQFKPAWWPENISWTWPESDNSKDIQIKEDTMREIIRSCYRHHGQENLLSAAATPSQTKTASPKKILSTQNENQCPPIAKESEDRVLEDSDKVKEVSSPIWVCFICTQQFDDQDVLMEHQDECERRAEAEEALNPPPPPPPPRHRIVWMKRKRRKFKPEPYVPPPKDVFIKQLYLSEKPKSAEECEKSVKADSDSDCEIIDVDLTETPVTPRTPKSLISQLSKDADSNVRRRHLSFSQVAASDSEDETVDPTKPTPAISSLLYNIDITSALGKRVKKHLKLDHSVPILRNADKYCRGPEKNEFTEKLRQRDSIFPIVFHKNNRRKFRVRYHHKYKFNRAQRKEFLITLKTGLNKRSRKLLSQVSPCKVQLERLDPEVIQEWVRRKPRPMFYQQSYQQSRYNRLYGMLPGHSNLVQNRQALLAQVLRKSVYGPLSAKLRHIQQNVQRVNEPRYTCNDTGMITQTIRNPDGTESMRIFRNPQINRPIQPRPQSDSRRKQTFDKERLKAMENEVIIIDMSSSDEEEEVSKPAASSAAAVRRSPIPVRPTSGPIASKPTRPIVAEPTVTKPKPKIGPACSKYGRRSANLSTCLNINAATVSNTVSMQPSPPGAQTCRELQINRLPISSSASRNLQFGQKGQGLLQTSVTKPGNQDYSNRSAVTVNGHTHYRLQGPPTRTLGPSGQKVLINRQERAPSTFIQLGRPAVPQVPVKTSVCKMEVSSKDNEKQVVDVICIDDD